MTVYFISDLHLDASRPQVTAALAEFLEARTGARALYILGDLFEFWVGDDDDSPIAQDVAALLRHYSESGPELYLMHGNRDFLMGSEFAAAVGAVLLNDPTVINLGNQSVLLMHGDSLCTRDEDYMAFRAVARSQEWQASALAHSLEERRALAQQLRMASKDAGSRKADDIMDVTPDEVTKVMVENHCTTLIHGHTHRPARHDTDAGVRWVLGDWEQTGWYLKAEADDLELVQFDINE